MATSRGNKYPDWGSSLKTLRELVAEMNNLRRTRFGAKETDDFAAPVNVPSLESCHVTLRSAQMPAAQKKAIIQGFFRD